MHESLKWFQPVVSFRLCSAKTGFMAVMNLDSWLWLYFTSKLLAWEFHGGQDLTRQCRRASYHMYRVENFNVVQSATFYIGAMPPTPPLQKAGEQTAPLRLCACGYPLSDKRKKKCTWWLRILGNLNQVDLGLKPHLTNNWQPILRLPFKVGINLHVEKIAGTFKFDSVHICPQSHQGRVSIN